MILNVVSADFKAYIEVTYPKGVCTCTLGDTTYTHSGGGTHTFTVKKTGIWTIKIESGSLSKSDTVVIDKYNENETLHIDYTTYLYNGGDDNSIKDVWVADKEPHVWFTENGYDYYGAPGVTPTLVTNDSTMIITVKGGQYASGSVYTVNPIDLTDYEKITLTGSGSTGTWRLLYITSSLSVNYNEIKTSNKVGLVSNGNTELDVSDIKGTYFIGIGLYATNNSTAKYTVSSITLS